MICAIAASDRIHHVGYDTAMSDIFGRELTSSPSADLARAALWSLPEVEPYTRTAGRIQWAEAEALLRTGWEP